MVRYIAHPKDKAQATAVKAFFKALKVPFETEPESNESPYNPEFVAKILQGDEDFKAGKGVQVDLKKFFSL